MMKPTIRGNSITIPSSQDYLSDVDVFLEGMLRGFEVDESAIADIAISVSELVNNAILHGNESSMDKAVTVTVSKNDGRVEISVADQGGGFDPTSVKNPIDNGNLLKEVGRGIFIVRSLMDEVAIEATERGTTVTVKKNV
jgi:serine/threonine-protein kinase RsbW